MNLYNAVGRRRRPGRARPRRARRRSTTRSTTRRDVHEDEHDRAPDVRLAQPRPARRRATTASRAASSPPTWKHTDEERVRRSPMPDALPRVDIVYAHARRGGTDREAAVAAGAKGSCSPASATATAPRRSIDALAAAAKKGWWSCAARASARHRRAATSSGRRQARVRRRDELNPQKARVLLQRAHEDEGRQADPEVLRRVRLPDGGPARAFGLDLNWRHEIERGWRLSHLTIAFHGV